MQIHNHFERILNILNMLQIQKLLCTTWLRLLWQNARIKLVKNFLQKKPKKIILQFFKFIMAELKLQKRYQA